MNEVRRTVAEEVRVLLTRRAITQKVLAAEIGMGQPQMSRRLKGHVPFDVDELEAIAAFFDVPITDLFGAADLRNRGTRCISDSPDGAVSVPLVPAA